MSERSSLLDVVRHGISKQGNPILQSHFYESLAREVAPPTDLDGRNLISVALDPNGD